MTETKRTVLNVGGGSKKIPIPACYAEFEHHLLDIQPGEDVDVVCDARDLGYMAQNQYDAIYCAHNLEHYEEHDVLFVMRGFHHVLKPGGTVYVIVPDVYGLMETMFQRKHTLTDEAYESPSGPIRYHDVIYGHGKSLLRNPFMAHRMAFTWGSLGQLFRTAGFTLAHNEVRPEPTWEIHALGLKQS